MSNRLDPRQMAAAPLRSVDKVPDAVPVADAAPVAAPVPPAEVADVQADNPIVQKLGWPTFRLVSNANWYPDDRNPNRSNMKFALVDFDLGGLTLSATIYRERELVQRANGRFNQFSLRLSMPKAISVNKDDAATVLHLQSFKADIMGRFQQFKAALDPTQLQRAAKDRGTWSDGEEAAPAA